MISGSQLERAIQKLNPRIRLYAHRSSKYDEHTPASLELEDIREKRRYSQLFSVPKGFIYERSSWDNDGCMIARGYIAIAQMLQGLHLLRKEALLKLIRRTEAGMVI